MALNVLLIDSDVDAVSDLAAALRARGLSVALADSLEVALDQVQKLPPDAILVRTAAAYDQPWSEIFETEPALRGLPWFELVESGQALRPGQLPRAEPDLIARKLWSIESTPPPVSSIGGDFRGDLKQVGVTDLLQLLSMNRRTGSLTITTAAGVGEVRLAHGEIVDAIYRKVEGSKALFRLIGEPEGSFAFMSGVTTAQRRVEESTQALLLEGFRQVDEIRNSRQEIGADQDALQSVTPAGTFGQELPDRILSALEVPHTIDELLDLLPENDLAIVKATQELMQVGRVRRIARGAVRVELADPEQLNALSNVVRQLRRPGFAGNPRIIVFASPNSLGAALHSLGRIADAWHASDLTPVAPAAHTLATLRMNDGAELDVVGLPSSPGCGPVWGMTLSGSAAVIALGDEQFGAIEEACNIYGITFVRAEVLLGSVEVGDPKQMALLVRAALEAAAGR